VTDSATFTTSENKDEDLGEDLGDLLLEVLPPVRPLRPLVQAHPALTGIRAGRGKAAILL